MEAIVRRRDARGEQGDSAAGAARGAKRDICVAGVEEPLRGLSARIAVPAERTRKERVRPIWRTLAPPADAASPPHTVRQRTGPRFTPRQTAWLLRRRDDALAPPERRYVAALIAQSPELAAVRRLAHSFQDLFTTHDASGLAAWLGQADQSELRSFARGVARDRDAVLAALCFRWSNGPVEGQGQSPQADQAPRVRPHRFRAAAPARPPRRIALRARATAKPDAIIKSADDPNLGVLAHATLAARSAQRGEFRPHARTAVARLYALMDRPNLLRDHVSRLLASGALGPARQA